MTGYLTPRRMAVLEFVDRSIRENGFAPSLDEICEAMHLSSLATVHKHLRALEDGGYIERDYNCARAILVIKRGKEVLANLAPTPNLCSRCGNEIEGTR